MSDLSQAHIGSGQVMTVAGPIAAAALGVTLMHEHLLNDCRCWWNKPKDPQRSRLACEPVHPGILGELRMDPFVNISNCTLDDERLAIAELADVVALGGRTVVDPTCQGIGRDPRALLRISQSTGLNIVMGGGFYLQASHPERVRGMAARIECTSARPAAAASAVTGSQPPTSFEYTDACCRPSDTSAACNA